MDGSPPPLPGPDLSELAEDWLTAKRVGDRPGDPGNSARARRTDLARWADAFTAALGRDIPESTVGLSIWRHISVTELADPDTTLLALQLLAEAGLAASTRQRLLATLRGWCSWLHRRGHLESDPTMNDEIRLRGTERDLDNKTFTLDDVEQLIIAAGMEPSARERSMWPARDIAIVATIAGCGLRVSELCNATTRTYDTNHQQPVLRLKNAKGGKARVIPIPATTVTAIDTYLTERTVLAATTTPLAIRPKSRMFVRRDGGPLTQPLIDRLLRRLCVRTGLTQPDGAMAHALRHHYGTQLAVRGVPLPVIQQLLGHTDPRTTSIYTRAASADTTHILHEAGWLK